MGVQVSSPASNRHRGAIPRDVLSGLCADGLTTRAIAERVDRSHYTVRYWLQRYGLKTHHLPQPATAATWCPVHDLPRPEAGNGRRCPQCATEAVRRRIRRAKALLVSEAGGCCIRCGYDRCQDALQFHHRDPSAKAFSISGGARSLARLRAEAAKCDLLCANCHAEVEYARI